MGDVPAQALIEESIYDYPPARPSAKQKQTQDDVPPALASETKEKSTPQFANMEESVKENEPQDDVPPALNDEQSVNEGSSDQPSENADKSAAKFTQPSVGTSENADQSAAMSTQPSVGTSVNEEESIYDVPPSSREEKVKPVPKPRKMNPSEKSVTPENITPTAQDEASFSSRTDATVEDPARDKPSEATDEVTQAKKEKDRKESTYIDMDSFQREMQKAGLLKKPTYAGNRVVQKFDLNMVPPARTMAQHTLGDGDGNVPRKRSVADPTQPGYMDMTHSSANQTKDLFEMSYGHIDMTQMLQLGRDMSGAIYDTNMTQSPGPPPPPCSYDVCDAGPVPKQLPRTPPPLPPKPLKKQEDIDQCHISEQPNMATTPSTSSCDRIRDNKEVIKDDLVDRTSVDDGVYVDEEKGLKVHHDAVHRSPSPMRSIYFPDAVHCSPSPMRSIYFPDAVHRSPSPMRSIYFRDAVHCSQSPMRSPEEQLNGQQGQSERTGRNADSGGSGYFSEDPVHDPTTTTDRLRKLPGRQDSEDIFMTSDSFSEDPFLLRVKDLPVTATRSSLEAAIQRASVKLEDIKTIQMSPYEKEAILHFFDPSAKATAEKTLKIMPMKVEEQELKVFNTRLDIDPLKLFVSGLSRKSNVKNLAEALRVVGISSTDILVGNTPGTALVTFSCKEDVIKFHERYDGKGFEGQVLYIQPVEVSRSVMIKISGKRTPTRDEVRSYFENYDGRERTVTDIVWSFGKDGLVVSYGNPTNVLDVCSVKEHKMDDCKLTVCPYYPCLDLDSSVLTMPAAVELEGDLKHLAGFWNGSKIYKDKFHEILRRHHGILHHSKDGRLLVLCNVDRLEPNGTKKVVQWSEKCLAAIKEFSQSFSVVDKINVAKECWQEVFEKDLTQTSDNASVSIMEMQSQDCHLVIAGERALTSTLMTTIQQREQQIPTWSKRKMLKTHELELLQMMDDKAWKTLKPRFDQEQFICFEGASKHVDEAMRLLYQKLDRIYKKPVTGYGNMTEDLMKSLPASQYIKAKLRCKHATYAVDKSGIFLFALHQKDIEPAIKILVSCVQMKQHKLHANEVMNSPQWQQKLKELYDSKDGLFQIELTENEVRLVSIDYCFEEIYNDVLMFLDSLTAMNSFYEIDLGKWRFLKSNKNDKINKIYQLCKDLNVELIESEVPVRKGFAIRGRKVDCRKVLAELQKVVEMVHYQDCKIKDRYLRDFVRSEECIQELVRIEMATKSGLHFEKFSNLHHQPHEVASRKQGNQEIVITEGNVMDMIVDIVVNLSDSCLQNMSTLGAAIIEKVGFEFQVECDQFIRNKGELSDGQCFTKRMRQQQLPFKTIISVAVPLWRGGAQNEEDLLKFAIQNCLMATTECDCKTIVIPTPDATLNYPIEVASRVMIEAVNDYICAIEGHWRIEKVYLCAVTTQARHALEAELGKSAKKGFRTSLSNTDIRVHIVKGELAKQQAGVIVNSVNCDLKLTVGALSKSLLKEAGPQLQKECQDMYPDGIQQSEIAVTSGANLSCQKVFHGVLEGWDGGKGRAEQIMGLFIEKCLSMASEYFQESIAFPAIGTGRLKFQPEFVAELFLDCVYTYRCQNPKTSLRDVYLVVWPEDMDTLKGFQEVQARLRNSSGHPEGKYRPFSPQFFSQSSKFMKAFGDLSVEIVQGDITKEKTEAIVNSVVGLNLDSGAVSKAIFSAAGPSIQTECKTAENKKAMQQKGFVVTDSGFLDFCKKIIHLEAKVTKPEWRQILVKCLEVANDLGLHSLSFPAIGTGGRGCTPELVASALFMAIRKFSESPRESLRRIRVVIYQEEMLKTFVLEAKKTPHLRRSIFKRLNMDVDSSQGLISHLYGETEDRVQEAKQQLLDLFRRETINLGKKLASHLIVDSNMDGQAIKNIGQRHKVHVEISKLEITIEGWKAHVQAAKKDIDEFIDTLSW